MLVCCHGTYLCVGAGGKAHLQQGPLGKRKQKWQCQDIPVYMPSRNSPAPSYQQFSCLLSNPARGGRSQGVQARTCQPTGSFWATFLGCKLGPWGLGSCRALGKLARLALGWRRSGPPLCLRRKRTVFTPMWQWPHYKWQCVAAPWEMASSGSSLHPPVLLCLLLVLRGKYLAKK